MRTYQDKPGRKKAKAKPPSSVAAKPVAVKRRRDKEASKQALLRAAVEVFAERGYDAATTREVAQRAGVAEGLIHRYYVSKAGLLLAVITDYQDEQDRCAVDLPPPASTLEAEILAQFRFSAENLKENCDFARIVMSRSIVDPAVAKQMGKHIFDEKIPVTVERLRQFARDGKIGADVDLADLAYLMSSMAFCLNFMGSLVFGIPDARVRAMSALMAQMLAKGLAR